MIYNFLHYAKEYLEFNNISQTEFATRLGITQKHMNELLNGKMSITLEKALPGTKVRGCFKVKGKIPAIYITQNYKGKDLLNISKENKIPMSFIVGRLDKNGKIKYKSILYNKYKEE